jgi:hypothetical protein
LILDPEWKNLDPHWEVQHTIRGETVIYYGELMTKAFYDYEYIPYKEWSGILEKDINRS